MGTVYPSNFPTGVNYGPTWQGSSSSNSSPPPPPSFIAWTGGATGTFIPISTKHYPTTPHEGIHLGEIAAFRCWALNDGILTSTFMNTFMWGPGDVMIGKPQDGFGIHCWKNLSGALTYANDFRGQPIVFGRILIWGEICEHGDGYRAEFAKIIGIDGVRNYQERWHLFKGTSVLEQLQKTYGLDHDSKRKDSDCA